MKVKPSQKFGDKKVGNLCYKLSSGYYKDNVRVIFQWMSEGRLTPDQFRKIINTMQIDVQSKR